MMPPEDDSFQDGGEEQLHAPQVAEQQLVNKTAAALRLHLRETDIPRRARKRLIANLTGEPTPGKPDGRVILMVMGSVETATDVPITPSMLSFFREHGVIDANGWAAIRQQSKRAMGGRQRDSAVASYLMKARLGRAAISGGAKTAALRLFDAIRALHKAAA